MIQVYTGYKANLLLGSRHSFGVKLCLASRPDSEIKFKLWSTPGFSMQTFNRPTIKAYLTDETACVRSHVDPQDLTEIVNWIELHAGGVILWARFACREAITAIRRGECQTDIWSRLQTYPNEMKDAYHREWHKIEPQDMLQAAVALYLVANWFDEPPKSDSLSRNNMGRVYRHQQICLSVLHVRWCDIMVAVEDNKAKFLQTSLTRFESQMSNLLGNFLVFTQPSGIFWFHGVTVAMIHKTLSSFLESFAIYKDIIQVVVSKTGPLEPLGVFYARYILRMSNHLDQSRVGNELTFWGLSGYPYLDSALAELMTLEYMDDPDNVPLLRKAASSGIYRKFCSMRGQYCTFRSGSVLYKHREIHDFILHGYKNAFHDLVHHYEDAITTHDWEELFMIWINRTYRSHHNKVPLGQHQIVLTILEHLPPIAFYLSVCLTPLPPTQTLMQTFLQFAKDISGATNFKRSRRWKHAPADVLCCWAWSPYYARDYATQKFRLQVLMRAGVLLNRRVSDGGNVLHALLKFNPCKGEIFSYGFESRHPLEHLTKSKFSILIQLGADIDAEDDLGRKPIDIARQTLASLESSEDLRRKIYAFDNIRFEGLPSLIRNHIIPTLQSHMASSNPDADSLTVPQRSRQAKSHLDNLRDAFLLRPYFEEKD